VFDFRFGCAFFEHMFSPKRWQKKSPKCKNPKCLDIIDCPRAFIYSTYRIGMHLNTSPTSFEGLRGQKTRNRIQNLRNLKLAPKLQRVEANAKSTNSDLAYIYFTYLSHWGTWPGWGRRQRSPTPQTKRSKLLQTR